MREYGGFLPIETGINEYYRENCGYDIARFNIARYAIAEAVRISGCVKVWVPLYTCHSVIESLESQGILYSMYNISENLYPNLVSIADDEIILITTYFGIKDATFCSEMTKKYKNVIFDNTQSFYLAPVLKENVFNVYSPRKFFGVSDGAYLIALDLSNVGNYELDYSYDRAGFLLSSFEIGTNNVYSDYLKSEEQLNGSGIRMMSKLTRGLLGSVDYDGVAEIRRKNYMILAGMLENYNCLAQDCMLPNNCIPMIYPFLPSDGASLREYLVSNKIYVPQWWKWVLSEKMVSQFEADLSRELCPIPIDQRYSEDDMKIIASVVLEKFK